VEGDSEPNTLVRLRHELGTRAGGSVEPTSICSATSAIPAQRQLKAGSSRQPASTSCWATADKTIKTSPTVRLQEELETSWSACWSSTRCSTWTPPYDRERTIKRSGQLLGHA